MAMANLKTIILFLSLVAINGDVFASTQETAIPKNLQKEFASTLVSIDSIAEFPCVKNWLQMLVNRRGTGTAPHRLFIGKVFWNGQDDQFVRVYWPHDNSIMVLQINKLECNSNLKIDEDNDQLEWLETKGRIDLKKDVVPTLEDVGSSTYLVDKPWVEALIADCKKNGKMISLTPHRQSAQ